MSKFLEKAPDIRDLEIRRRLNKLRENDELFNRGNDNNNNNNNNNNNSNRNNDNNNSNTNNNDNNNNSKRNTKK